MSITEQLAIFNRDLGIQRSGDHAEMDSPEWIQRAAMMIRIYSASHAKFLIEDVVGFASEQGLPSPPDGRAWGAAARRAKSKGYIRSCGYRAAKSSNLSPKVLWEAIGERE